MIDEGVEFSLFIDTDKPLSTVRLGMYVAEFAKLLGVPAITIRVEQSDAVSPHVEKP